MQQPPGARNPQTANPPPLASRQGVRGGTKGLARRKAGSYDPQVGKRVVCVEQPRAVVHQGARMSSNADPKGLQAPSEDLRIAERVEDVARAIKDARFLVSGHRGNPHDYVVDDQDRIVARAAIAAYEADTVLGFKVVVDTSLPPDQMRLENERGAGIVVQTADISPYLRQPTRSATEAALQIAVKGLTVIANPVTGESHLERTMRMAAQTALDRVRALVPDAGK